MITIFNRAVLFQDVSAEAAANVWSTLKANNIPYEMKTKTGQGPFHRQLQQNANMRFTMGGTPASALDGPQRQYLYIIYVRKSDLEKAKELCSL